MSKFISLFDSTGPTEGRHEAEIERAADVPPPGRAPAPEGSKKMPASEFDRLASSALGDIQKFKDTVARCTGVFGLESPPTLRAISLQVLPFFAGSGLRELDARLDLEGRLASEFELIDARVRKWKETALDTGAGGAAEGFRRVEEQVARGEALLHRLKRTRAE